MVAKADEPLFGAVGRIPLTVIEVALLPVPLDVIPRLCKALLGIVHVNAAAGLERVSAETIGIAPLDGTGECVHIGRCRLRRSRTLC